MNHNFFNRRAVLAIFALVLAILFSFGAGADDYAKGNGALEVFDAEGISASPAWVQIWVGFMLLMFAIGLFVFAWKRPLARWVAGGFIVSAATGEMVFGALGLPFLSGAIAIMHLVCWTPGLILLLTQRPFANPEEGRWYRLWTGLMTGTILFSFVFDIRDAFIYISHLAGSA